MGTLTTTWIYDFTDKIKQEFFQAVAVSVLLYGCTTRTLRKRLKEKLHRTTREYRILFEQIQKVIHKTAVEWPLDSHLAGRPYK